MFVIAAMSVPQPSVGSTKHTCLDFFRQFYSLMFTRDVGMAFSTSDAISIETFLSPQIAIASSSNKFL
jgi:hypothetical protein